jgi:hypothetical protein
VRFGAVAAAIGLLKTRKQIEQQFMVFGIITAGIAGFLLCSYFAVGSLYVEIRHASVLFVPLILFLVALVHTLTVRLRRRSVIVGLISIILVFSYSYGFTALYPGFVKRGDWTRVAEYVEKNEEAGQPVIVFRTYEALAFGQSYHGKNKVLPDEKFFYWTYEGEIGTEAMWTKQIDWVISRIPRDSKEIWLVTEDICNTSEACRPLENFVKANYTVLEQKDFYKERVRLLRKQ